AGAIVDHHLDSAEVESGGASYALGGVDDILLRRYRSHPDCGTAGPSDAGVGGAEVEIVAAALDLDRIEKPPAQGLDPDDRAAACGDVILDQQHLVDGLGNGAVADRGAKLLSRRITDDPGARAADTGYDH